MDDDEVRCVHAVRVHELLHRTARRVHVALRLRQHKIDVAVGSLGRERAALRLPVTRAHLVSDDVHRVEPGIVPRVRVLLARIPQADDQKHETSFLPTGRTYASERGRGTSDSRDGEGEARLSTRVFGIARRLDTTPLAASAGPVVRRTTGPLLLEQARDAAVVVHVADGLREQRRHGEHLHLAGLARKRHGHGIRHHDLLDA